MRIAKTREQIPKMTTKSKRNGKVGRGLIFKLNFDRRPIQRYSRPSWRSPGPPGARSCCPAAGGAAAPCWTGWAGPVAVLKGCFEPILDLFHLNPEKVNIYTILEFFWYFVKVYIYYGDTICSNS